MKYSKEQLTALVPRIEEILNKVLPIGVERSVKVGSVLGSNYISIRAQLPKFIKSQNFTPNITTVSLKWDNDAELTDQVFAGYGGKSVYFLPEKGSFNALSRKTISFRKSDNEKSNFENIERFFSRWIELLQENKSIWAYTKDYDYSVLEDAEFYEKKQKDLEKMKLINKGLKQFPGSKRQKETLEKIKDLDKKDQETKETESNLVGNLFEVDYKDLKTINKYINTYWDINKIDPSKKIYISKRKSKKVAPGNDPFYLSIDQEGKEVVYLGTHPTENTDHGAIGFDKDGKISKYSIPKIEQAKFKENKQKAETESNLLKKLSPGLQKKLKDFGTTVVLIDENGEINTVSDYELDQSFIYAIEQELGLSQDVMGDFDEQGDLKNFEPQKETKKVEPPLPFLAPGEKVKVKSIKINYYEGKQTKKTPFEIKQPNIWSKLSEFLSGIYEDRPGYNKVGYTVIWDDGDEYTGRFEIGPTQDLPTENVFNNAIQKWIDYLKSDRSTLPGEKDYLPMYLSIMEDRETGPEKPTEKKQPKKPTETPQKPTENKPARKPTEKQRTSIKALLESDNDNYIILGTVYKLAKKVRDLETTKKDKFRVTRQMNIIKTGWIQEPQEKINQTAKLIGPRLYDILSRTKKGDQNLVGIFDNIYDLYKSYGNKPKKNTEQKEIERVQMALERLTKNT